MQQSNLLKDGLIWIILSYILWGLTPLFYQYFHGVDAMEIFAMRVLFSVPLIALLLWITGTPIRVFKMLITPKTFISLLLSTACISTSWYLNTWGATHGQVLMVSLAYFLTPLISILIGVIYLRERLSILQIIALIFCTSGFIYACISLDSFPWLTIGIAVAFGCYGVIKKQVKIDTLNGLAAETLLMIPFVMFYLVNMSDPTQWEIGENSTRILLMLTAPVTILPLALFSYGVARIKNLSTIAILQYIEPTLYFLLAVFIFGEVMNMERLTTFILIWIGFTVFSIDGIRRAKLAKFAENIIVERTER